MKIERVLNNNAVISTREEQEVIVIGRGIAFNKRVEDDINEKEIEKIFILENEGTSKKLKILFGDMPIEYMDISEKIIKYAEKN